ncbi:hypothetical protein MTR67_024130 [Solanum verrucosum]|uniref:Uncharacterized protein n=1 Tax=Solanum verrucosum TaxID=315347 RepID=A0AAF0TY98_SOLVR|nr:hypothetical protein MTR67_024130 [Solanum verrucosum]
MMEQWEDTMEEKDSCKGTRSRFFLAHPIQGCKKLCQSLRQMPEKR